LNPHSIPATLFLRKWPYFQQSITDRTRVAGMKIFERELGRLLLLVQFFTRLPLPAQLRERVDQEETLSNAAHLFPVAGLVVSIAPAFVWYVCYPLLPPTVAAGLAILTGLILTGALHEDGLSDCADGLGGGSTKKRALEIMKDSRIGAFGACALIMSVFLRWMALASLDVISGIVAIIIMHAVARAAMTTAIRYSTYVRPKGLGKSVSDGISDYQLGIALGIGAFFALTLGGLAGLTAAAIGTGAAIIVLLYLENRLNGYTGDGLGAMEQSAEIAVMVTLAGFWGGVSA